MVDVFQERRDYFEALGEFIQNFAEVENFLKLLCSILAQTDAKTSEILFSNYSINHAKTFIEATIKERGYKHSELALKCLSQLLIISQKRNKIIHLGVRFQDNNMLVSSMFSRTQDNKQNGFVIETKDIASMAKDLRSILNVMSAFLLRVSIKLPGTIFSGASPDSFIEPFERAARAPWQYIPLEQRKSDSAPTQES